MPAKSKTATGYLQESYSRLYISLRHVLHHTGKGNIIYFTQTIYNLLFT